MSIGFWDLSHLYKSLDDFYADYEKLKEQLKELKKYKGRLKLASKDVILEYLKKETEFSVILEKLAVYAFCKKDDDGKNLANVKIDTLIDDFCAKSSEELAFSKTELSMLDEKFLLEIQNNDKFSDFDRTINDIIRYKKHTLSEKEEQNLAVISSFNNTSTIFSCLSDIEMYHGEFKDEKGEIIKLFPGNYSFYMHSDNPETRAKVMETYLAEYAKLNQTFSSLFASHIKYQNYMAKTYGFDSVLHRKTYAEEVTPEIMMVNIKEVKSKVKLLQDYFAIKKKLLNLKEFKTSDISVPINLGKPVNIEYKQAIEDIYNSMSVLGKDYQEKFKEAVNSGWIDAFPRENKRSGGYTISTYQTHPYILLNFDGTFDWASAITHEFGHAMHSYYSALTQPYPKYEYTLFVAEIVSLTNEILYNRYLINKTTDKNTKIKLLSDFLQLFELNVFDSTMLAEFELFVHNSLSAGETLTSESFNNKFVELSKEYFGKDIVFNKNYEVNWSRKGHIYRDYYLYKYSLGLCCACGISKRLLDDTTGDYLKKYKEFLSLGGSKDPISSLKVADVNVLDGKIYKDAFSMFENYLNELKNITKEN